MDAFDFALTVNEGDVSVLKMKALSLFLNDNLEQAIAFKECLQRSPNMKQFTIRIAYATMTV